MCEDAQIDDPSVVAATVAYLTGRLARLKGLAEDISDPLDQPDLEAAMMFWYIESKCEWCHLNQRLNYQMMSGKVPNQLLLMQGGIGTAVLDRVEALIGRSEAEAINDFLSAPLNNANELLESRDMRLSDGCYEIEDSLRASLAKTLENIEEFQFTLSAVRNDPERIGHATSVYEGTVKSAQNQLRQLNDFGRYIKPLKKRISRLSRLKGVRALVDFDIEQNASLDGPRVTALMEVAEVWVEEIFAYGLESDPRQRVEAGKSAHASFRIVLASDGERVSLSILDDGATIEPSRIGTYESLPSWSVGSFGGSLCSIRSLASIADWKLSIEAGEHFGNCLTVSLPPAPNLNAKNYVVAACAGQRFAIEADRVTTIVPLSAASIQAQSTNPMVVLHGITHDAFHLDRRLALASKGSQDCVALACVHTGRPLAILVDHVDTLQRGICRPIDSNAVRPGPEVAGILELSNGYCLVLDLDEVLAA